MSNKNKPLDQKRPKKSSTMANRTKRISDQLTAKAQKDFLLMGILLFFFAFIILAILK
jgi:hypothetical protein